MVTAKCAEERFGCGEIDKELMDGLPGARAPAEEGSKLLFDFVDVLPFFHFAGELALVSGLEQADPADFAKVHANGIIDDVHVLELLYPLAIDVGLVGLFLVVVVVTGAIAVFRCAVTPRQDDFRFAHPVAIFPGFAGLDKVSGGYPLRDAHNHIVDAVAVHVSHILCPQSVFVSACNLDCRCVNERL